MPVFGPMGIRKMWDGMMDVASQMLLRWDRFGSENVILCSDEFTRYRETPKPKHFLPPFFVLEAKERERRGTDTMGWLD